LRLEEFLPYIGIRAGLAHRSEAGVEEEERRMSRVLALTCIPSQVTVGRGSTSSGSACRAGRTRPPLVGVWSGPRRRTSCGSALVLRHQRSRRSPPHRCERTRRDATEATRRWRVHPTVGAHTGEGLKVVPRARSLRSRSSADEVARLLVAAREWEQRNE
jgi:hypothetical protein